MVILSLQDRMDLLHNERFNSLCSNSVSVIYRWPVIVTLLLGVTVKGSSKARLFPWKASVVCISWPATLSDGQTDR